MHKCNLDVPGGEGFRNVRALRSFCGGTKQVFLLAGVGELGLTPVQSLEPSLENAYNCLLKE